MSGQSDTFFTVVGCMDGRAQIPVQEYGQKLFEAQYGDTITEAGIVGILAHNPSQEFVNDFKKKINISVDLHHSKGILVFGHEECAGNPVSEEQHKKDVLTSAKLIRELNPNIKVVPAFVRKTDEGWVVEEV